MYSYRVGNARTLLVALNVGFTVGATTPSCALTGNCSTVGVTVGIGVTVTVAVGTGVATTILAGTPATEEADRLPATYATPVHPTVSTANKLVVIIFFDLTGSCIF